MKMFGWLLCGLAVLVLGCEPVEVKTDTDEGEMPEHVRQFRRKYKKVDVPWDTPPAVDAQADALPRVDFEQLDVTDPVWRLRGEKPIVAASVNLTEDQKRRIEQLYAEEEQALSKWDEAHQGRLDELRIKINQLWDERNWLNHQRQRLRFAHQAHRRGVLTEQQNCDLHSFMLYKMIMRRRGIKKMNLTAEQRAAIRAICDQMAPQSLKLIDERMSREREKLQRDVADRVMKEVLTPEQLKVITRGRKLPTQAPKVESEPDTEPATREGD